jgi:hypothetical protein
MLSTFPGTRSEQISAVILWSCVAAFGYHIHAYISHAQIFENTGYLIHYARLASQLLFQISNCFNVFVGFRGYGFTGFRIKVHVFSTTYKNVVPFRYASARHCCVTTSINPLTSELNPSPQRCLTRFLLGILLLEPCISLIYA